MRQEFITHSPEETKGLAARLANRLRGGEVLAFTGGMGMGKTAFALNLASNAAFSTEKAVAIF